MSENGSEYSNGGSNLGVCRDYLRNVCRRGKRCKFSHPDEKESDSSKNEEYSFCHDFQNSKCSRSTCRFVHGSQEDEEYYKSTGELPPHILEAVQRQNVIPEDPHGNQSLVPVCKDYLKGECRRGGNCKFRHLSVRDHEMELSCGQTPSSIPNRDVGLRRRRYEFPEERFNGNNNYNPDYQREYGPPEVKRQHFEAMSPPSFFREPPPMSNQYYQPTLGVSHIETRSVMFHDENLFLRKRIEELRKQVSDLTATNEFLLDQNAQLRMSGKRTGIGMPQVTITNAGTSTMQVQPMTAQIQSSSIPTSAQHLVSAAMAGTLRTVTASVATVPVSIATVAGTPVSIATVSMAPVQMQPPIVTMAQTITVDGAHSSQLNGSTASLLSYPIMTHDLRPVLQTSLSH